MIPELEDGRPRADAEGRNSLADQYATIRNYSEQIFGTLNPEDCVLQSMPDASPIRWHLAHETWFFEAFVLRRFADYKWYNEEYDLLFNSYYNTVGEQFPRHNRGLLSRPTVAEVLDYRHRVDEQLLQYLDREHCWSSGLLDIVQLGLQHEQQHQELMLTDIKNALFCNPLYPAMLTGDPIEVEPPALNWVPFEEGVYQIGHHGEGFAYDNETPRHRVFIEPFSLANRLVTNGEFLEFMQDGGYREPAHWLSLGWACVQQNSWTAPLYWIEKDGTFYQYTLAGLKTLNPSQPVAHLSYFEADAYARWAGARLPTEAEWEIAAVDHVGAVMSAEDHFVLGRPNHPTHSDDDQLIQSLFGSVWQWTSSAYAAYPGYKPPHGALGEYNGKFMCNQYVLRGSSCCTSRNHARYSYRNFFGTTARWQFAGLRLAANA